MTLAELIAEELAADRRILRDRHSDEPGVKEVGFFCPGCGYGHGVRVAGPAPVWKFNGDYNAPTFAPSIKISASTGYVCHFFVKAGVVEFCGDCTHELKGQHVPLEPF